MKRLLFIFGLILLFGCKKDELPADQIGDPVFVSAVNFNGQDYSLAAGEQNLVLAPETEVSDSEVMFYSDLSNPSCTECGPALKLEIASPPSVIPGTISSWINALESWDYVLNLQEPDTSQALSITANNGNNTSDGLWYLDGELLSQTQSSEISFDIEDPGNHELFFEDPDSACTAAGLLNIDFNGEDIPCYGSISQSLFDPSIIVAEPGPAFDPNATVNVWIIDGQIIASGGPNTIVVDVDNVNQVCVILIDVSGGCTDTICYIPQNQFNPCVNNLRIANSEIVSIITEPLDQSLVRLAFRDEEGMLYASSSQNENSSIELVDIVAYQEPTRPGETFAQVVFEVNCLLYDEGGQAFPFSGTVNMALELP